MTKQSNKAPYTNVFSQWSKALGPVPTEAQLAVIHAFKRAGGKEALGMAMALRDGGMTAAQMTNASALFDGNPTTCRNTIKRFIGAGMFDGGTQNGAVRITLTPKGKAWVDRASEAAKAKPADKPVKGKAAKAAPTKAKRASKPRAVKAPAPQVAPQPEPTEAPAAPQS